MILTSLVATEALLLAFLSKVVYSACFRAGTLDEVAAVEAIACATPGA